MKRLALMWHLAYWMPHSRSSSPILTSLLFQGLVFRPPHIRTLDRLSQYPAGYSLISWKYLYALSFLCWVMLLQTLRKPGYLLILGEKGCSVKVCSQKTLKTAVWHSPEGSVQLVPLLVRCLLMQVHRECSGVMGGKGKWSQDSGDVGDS